MLFILRMSCGWVIIVSLLHCLFSHAAVVEQHHSLPVAQKSAPDYSRTVKCKGRHELSNAEQLSRVVCVLILLPDYTVSQFANLQSSVFVFLTSCSHGNSASCSCSNSSCKDNSRSSPNYEM